MGYKIELQDPAIPLPIGTLPRADSRSRVSSKRSSRTKGAECPHLDKRLPTWHKAVPGVPQGNAISMEILLPCTMDFKVDMHLPVLEEARLQGKQKELLRAPQAILPARDDPAQARLLH